MIHDNPKYGIQRFDLSEDRSSEDKYELIQAPNTNLITIVDAPNEAKLHFGTKQAPGLDAQNYGSIERAEDKAFGTVYLSNPPSGGTLTLLMGVDITGDIEETIGTVESIRETVTVTDDGAFNVAGTVTTDLTGNIGRSVGTVRQEQPTAVTAFSHSTAGTTAEQLPANVVSPTGAITVQADPANTGSLFVGNATAQVIELTPGDTVSDLNVSNTNALYVQTPTSGDTANVIAQ